MIYLLLVLGLGLLVVGGDFLVRGAVALATRSGVSPLMIGLTLVGFGTSTPELITSLQAAYLGAPGIALGNVVGSNIANILLIVGIAALMQPIAVGGGLMRRDGTVLVLATGLCILAIGQGALVRGWGIGFVLALVGYIALAYWMERDQPDADIPAPEGGMKIWVAVVLALGGIAMTILGARLLVDNSIVIARDFGVSETLIGLTIVAVGTSLPELVTAIMAGLRGHSDVALGNVIGSNIYNILGILGVTALFKPIDVPEELAASDIWVMAGATALFLIFAFSGKRITRTEGGVLVLCYAGYLVWLGLGAFQGA